MNVLVIDVGGTHVKILVTGQKEMREFPSGPTLTAKQMVAGVKKLAGNWKYDAVSIGYPGTLSETDRSPSRITSDVDGLDLTLKLPSSVR